jgi:hypothetical protein
MDDEVLDSLVVMNENDAAEGIIQLAFDASNAKRPKEQLITTVEYSDIVYHPSPPHPPPQPEHRGKNIEMLKAQYAKETTTNNEANKAPPTLSKLLPTSVTNEVADLRKQAFLHAVAKKTPPKRKRKRTTNVLGSGRPTNDQTMLRIANAQDDDHDEALVVKQLLLLSSSGEIRKKTTIYTKNPEDIKCYAIKHYNSFSHIAEQRKSVLDIIKKQRTVLEQLAYLETCLLPLVRENATF